MAHADAPPKENRKRGIVFSRVALTGSRGDVAHNDMISIKLEIQYVLLIKYTLRFKNPRLKKNISKLNSFFFLMYYLLVNCKLQKNVFIEIQLAKNCWK